MLLRRTIFLRCSYEISAWAPPMREPCNARPLRHLTPRAEWQGHTCDRAHWRINWGGCVALLIAIRPRSTSGAARDSINTGRDGRIRRLSAGVRTGNCMILRSPDLLVAIPGAPVGACVAFRYATVPVTLSVLGVIDPQARHLRSADAW